MLELTPLQNAAKAKCLGSHEKYYYILLLGTYTEARGKGLGASIVRHYQSIAAREHLPIWLESGTEASLRLYLRLDFVVVDEYVIGKGKAAADGSQCKGGPGVKIWAMIWRPHPRSPS